MTYTASINKRKLVANRWKIRNRLGEGTYGSVFAVFDTQTGNTHAAKFEHVEKGFNFLPHENCIYDNLIQASSFSPGFGRKHFYGQHGKFRVLIIDRLGESLLELLIQCGQFSAKTVAMIGIQALKRIEFMHKRGYVHGDLKPENMMMGLGSDRERVHLIDFGSSSCIIDGSTGHHIAFKDELPFIGTSAFASRNAHMGIKATRRDDLESLAYILIYLFKGSLPWEVLEDEGEDRRVRSVRILRMKTDCDRSVLCKGIGFITTFLKYCSELAYDEVPDYMFLRMILKNSLAVRDTYEDRVFDWSSFYQTEGDSNVGRMVDAVRRMSCF